MYRNRTVSLVLVGLFLWVTACSSHTRIEPGEVAHHGKVRVTLQDGERETIRDPWVEDDSIRGREAAFALDQVADLEAVGTDEAGTVFTVLGVLVGAAVLTYAVGCAVSDTSDAFIDPCVY